MTFFVIGLLIIILIALFLLMRKPKKPVGDFFDEQIYESTGPSTKPCPICFHPLVKGQTVKSKLITIQNDSKFKTQVQESISHIFGCPFCYPSNDQDPRFCPVCKNKLTSADFVIGRYFEKKQGKNHLHVLGCTQCRKSQF